ncbi:hypothetical protein [Actinoplanes palleronii]|uniref:Uncharacterized protein n=1 Tax=Actinoplanes palleronii TaxID=113570 RepID=A0ABQ4B6N0_9ACTN|nr:hypothetical protein [Actinoplanes palleronii]GIE65920.1 hypothetical protein Apa02nite_020280 [Actinoplanes palleronii]
MGVDRSQFTAVLVVGNFFVGILAALPLALLFSLLVNVTSPSFGEAHHSYVTIFGHHPPFEVDSDEVGGAAMLLVMAGLLIGAVFAGVNSTAHRLKPPAMAGALVWLAGLTIALLPWFACMAIWWSRV